ncbi:hypothetical protein ACIQ2D_14305 [Lysinibacillus sp. NPDC097287]|uniref:hypothetical protein n=1 Tax=Lysinibacillus sp. NPDC097287 TaxID=3364144 RepID=UPI0038247112
MKINTGKETINFYKTTTMSASKKNILQTQYRVQKDKLTIGQQARNLFKGQQHKTNLIESLIKQRENIQEMKSNLTERTIDNGEDITSIKEQLKEFEKQIAEIDAQIAEQQIVEQKKPNEDMQVAGKHSATPTDELLVKTTLLDQAKTLHTTNDALKREQHRLESEVNLDANRGIFIDRKYEKLSNLENRIQDTQEAVAEKIEDFSDTTFEDKSSEDIAKEKQENNEDRND